jgi:hypothetical protein
VVGLHLAAPGGLLLGLALRLVTSDQFVVPTIRLPVAPQQLASAVLTLAVGWMLVDEWPVLVRTTAARAVAMAGLRWGATHVVAVGSATIAVAGVPAYDAVPLASLMCSLAALVSVVARQAWWIPPLLLGYVVLRINNVIDPHDPVAHDLAWPILIGLVSVCVYVGASGWRQRLRME